MQELLSCCVNGLSGSVVFELQRGEPIISKRTQTKRYGKALDRKPLTATG